MDALGASRGLSAKELDAIDMAVTAVVFGAERNHTSTAGNSHHRLRLQRALGQHLLETLDAAAISTAVLQLCAVMSSGSIPRESPRW
ncbi:hypothetical protein CBR_g2978 [Chara braunii]|uniref:Uncharacterized protein n=1 Tax=Chara braunii TaxID=69332 RepID=A0A388KEE8_CHABU|nr:hypothetical protein CBR_g2978 [Chara braunii]|eukprot:GBG68434.1 hypothetical protein CBR_g2978 [Chara braunii]